MRWFGKCKHEHKRCVHGDEINQAGGARAYCLDCNKYLKKEVLPRICSITGFPHRSSLYYE